MKEFNKVKNLQNIIEFNRDKLAKAKSSVIWYEKEIKEYEKNLKNWRANNAAPFFIQKN